MTVELILTSSVVSAVVSAILGPAIFFALKTKEDRRRHRFDTKFAEFKHYLKALEDISHFTGEEFEKYMAGPAQQCIEAVLTSTSEEQTNQALASMNREMTEFVSKLTKAFRQATSELQGLRLVCSNELLGMVNEFVRNQERMLNESIGLMQQIKFSPSGSVDTPASSALVAEGAASKVLFERIVEQMRLELGTHEP